MAHLMSKLNIFSVLIILLSCSFARADFYTGATVGYLFDSKKPLLATQFGYTLGDPGEIRYEFEWELGYTKDSDSGLSGRVVPIMVNTKFHFPHTQSLSSYIGAGIGFSYVKWRLKGTNLSDSDEAFTYQLFAGFRKDINPNISLSLGYRYLRLVDVFNAGDADDGALEVGFRFNF